MSNPDVFIVGGARTPMTDYVGALKDVSALELGAVAARGAFGKTGVGPEWIEHVVIGNVIQTSADGIYGARHVGLKAGIPVGVPALTVNRLCGSGIQAAVSGAQLIQLGEADLVLTGGVENMSQAPHVIRGLRSGLRLGQGKLEDSLWEALLDTHCGCTMAMTAENCAAKYGISRDEQDRYALRSQQLADAAWREGRFADEVVPSLSDRPSQAVTRADPRIVERDDHMRPEEHARGACRAAAGVQERRHRHRGQCQRHRRRWGRPDPRVQRGGRTPGPDADGALGGLGGCRRRPDADGDGAGAGDAPGAGAHRADAGCHRSHRGQRGLCRAVSRGREGARARRGRR